ITLPGVSSVIAPLPPVVVVVVVCETCAHANGATTAQAVLSKNIFLFSCLLCSFRRGEPSHATSCLTARPRGVSKRFVRQMLQPASLLTCCSNTGRKLRVLGEIRSRDRLFCHSLNCALVLVRFDHLLDTPIRFFASCAQRGKERENTCRSKRGRK